MSKRNSWKKMKEKILSNPGVAKEYIKVLEKKLFSSRLRWENIAKDTLTVEFIMMD